MKAKLFAVASAAMITLTAAAIPNQAEARWRGYGYGGWWAPGAAIGGFALGAAIASRPYRYGYGPYYGGYADGGPYAYYGGVGPYDYEYNGSYPYQRSYNAPKHWTEF